MSSNKKTKLRFEKRHCRSELQRMSWCVGTEKVTRLRSPGALHLRALGLTPCSRLQLSVHLNVCASSCEIPRVEGDSDVTTIRFSPFAQRIPDLLTLHSPERTVYTTMPDRFSEVLCSMTSRLPTPTQRFVRTGPDPFPLSRLSYRMSCRR